MVDFDFEGLPTRVNGARRDRRGLSVWRWAVSLSLGLLIALFVLSLSQTSTLASVSSPSSGSEGVVLAAVRDQGSCTALTPMQGKGKPGTAKNATQEAVTRTLYGQWLEEAAVRLDQDEESCFVVFIDVLRKHWIEPDMLIWGEVSYQDLMVMGFPMVVAKTFVEVIDDNSCTLLCEHGGMPSEDCSECVDCEGDWAGQSCEVCERSCSGEGYPAEDCLSCECPMDCGENGIPLPDCTGCECLGSWNGESCDTCDRECPGQSVPDEACLSCDCLLSCGENGRVPTDCSGCVCEGEWVGDVCNECSHPCPGQAYATDDCLDCICPLECGIHGSVPDDCSACVCEGDWSGETCEGCSKSCPGQSTPTADCLSCDCPLDSVCQKGRPSADCTQCVCEGGWEGEDCGTCSLECAHGGIPNDDCTSCINCLGAWSGTHCDEWDQSKVDVEAMKEQIKNWADLCEEEQQEVLSTFNPLPATVGFGVDAVTGQRRLPVVALTYSFDSDRVWTNKAGTTFRLPLEADFQPVPTGLTSPVEETWAFRSLASYHSAHTQMANRRLERTGIFSRDSSLQQMFDNHFQGDDGGLAITHNYYLLNQLSLPVSDAEGGETLQATGQYSFSLDDNCRRALESLPPSYDTEANKALYRTFIEYWGTSFASTSYNGGALEQQVKFYKELVSVYEKTEPEIAEQARLEMSGDNESLAGWYKNKRQVTGVHCHGGEPSTCSDFAAWIASVGEAWIQPVYYEISDISALIPNLNTRINIQKAINAFVDEKKGEIDMVDTCPVCENSGTCTPPHETCINCGGNAFGVRCERTQ